MFSSTVGISLKFGGITFDVERFIFQSGLWSGEGKSYAGMVFCSYWRQNMLNMLRKVRTLRSSTYMI